MKICLISLTDYHPLKYLLTEDDYGFYSNIFDDYFSSTILHRQWSSFVIYFENFTETEQKTYNFIKKLVVLREFVSPLVIVFGDGFERMNGIIKNTVANDDLIFPESQVSNLTKLLLLNTFNDSLENRKKKNKLLHEETNYRLDTRNAFKAIFESTSLPMFFLDNELQFIDTNNAFLELINYEKGDLFDKKLSDIIFEPESFLMPYLNESGKTIELKRVTLKCFDTFPIDVEIKMNTLFFGLQKGYLCLINQIYHKGEENHKQNILNRFLELNKKHIKFIDYAEESLSLLYDIGYFQFIRLKFFQNNSMSWQKIVINDKKEICEELNSDFDILNNYVEDRSNQEEIFTMEISYEEVKKFDLKNYPKIKSLVVIPLIITGELVGQITFLLRINIEKYWMSHSYFLYICHSIGQQIVNCNLKDLLKRKTGMVEELKSHLSKCAGSKDFSTNLVPDVDNDREMFRTFVSNLPFPSLFFDENGKLIDQNDNMILLTGYSKEYFDSMSAFFKIVKFPEVFVSKVVQFFSECRNGFLSNVSFNIELYNKQGKKKVLILNLISARNIKGELIGVIFIFIDITARKTDEKLTENLLILSNLINSAKNVRELGKNVINIIGSLIKIPTYMLYIYNQSNDMLEFIGGKGYDKSKFMRTNYKKISMKKEATSLAVQVAKSKTIIYFENFNIDKNAEKYKIDEFYESVKMALGVPLLYKNDIYGVLLFYSNAEYSLSQGEMALINLIVNELTHGISYKVLITELQKANYELKLQTTKALDSSRMKGEFVANITHELKTPLNSIITLSGILKSNKDDNLLDKQMKSIDIINRSGKNLLSLIEDILALSKIDEGKIDVNYTKIIIEELLFEIEDEILPLVEKKGLFWILDIKPDVPKIIITDRGKIYQIILNLLSNAIKFTENGRVELRVEYNSQNICFSVTDTGIGIPEKYHEMIFSQFHQLESSTTKKHGGTGLGLTIVKRLVELLKGKIELESEKGKGSKFVITVPDMTKL